MYLSAVKEVVKHCSHRTTSFRLKSVGELSSLLSSPSTDSAAHIGQLLDTVGALFIDDDRRVRCEARKLLRIILEHCNCVMSEVSPFFPLMISRLCCAMTHVHEDIR